MPKSTSSTRLLAAVFAPGALARGTAGAAGPAGASSGARYYAGGVGSRTAQTAGGALTFANVR